MHCHSFRIYRKHQLPSSAPLIFSISLINTYNQLLWWLQTDVLICALIVWLLRPNNSGGFRGRGQGAMPMAPAPSKKKTPLLKPSKTTFLTRWPENSHDPPPQNSSCGVLSHNRPSSAQSCSDRCYTQWLLSGYVTGQWARAPYKQSTRSTLNSVTRSPAYIKGKGNHFPIHGLVNLL